ncbi:uncharacterized protein MELLADRAFT_104581 [Melampsora larici-populina 98AG31]|uniref:Uncharacterized protein n=1 Tax=Melampsora larici-populina (strain 98AG31 / pathotype 3-4-7) TaxID=747676 RepID=F4RF74_MELLP|nr:uncharacterized protein MELLADRAFT_104581 [Melampsora larici-populina 98AG31]EGG08763.1 hypothetical protein MELLADRAFT_104581 [Melampsora larici-populina 98AG31]
MGLYSSPQLLAHSKIQIGPCSHPVNTIALTNSLTYLSLGLANVRRGLDSESDDLGSLWGTSFEIYPDEPLGPATALAEGYVPLSQFHSQKRLTDLTNRNHTIQADHVFSLDQCNLDETQPLIESETSNMVPPSTPRTIKGPRKRRQKTLDPKEPRRLLAPVELYDRPWSGLITDDSQSLLGTSGDPHTRRPPKQSKTDLSTYTPLTRLQNWYNKPKESNFGFGASNQRDTEKTFGSTFKNPSCHATAPSQCKLSFRVLLPHPWDC